MEVAETLSTFMVNDMPDAARFFEVASGLVRQPPRQGKESILGLWLGESVHLCLWAEGKVDAAIRLEHLWDELVTIFEMDPLCGYALSSFHGEENKQVFQSICAEHSAVYSR